MKKKTSLDYKFIRLIGEGSFSSVYLAVDADATVNSAKPSKYAIKVCQKTHIKRQNKQAAIMREKEIMNIMNQNLSEHFVRLYYTFQDTNRLFFVMSYAEHGELLTYMQKNPLDLQTVRKFTLQLVVALEHMHKLSIIHRDLKPENILLNERMNIVVSDFGSAQILKDAHDTSNNLSSNSNSSPNAVVQDRRSSFVGTAQYVSPEMLKNRQASNKSDLWALGIIIFQMITNTMLFNAPNEYLIYQKIQSLDYEFPPDFDECARDLVSSLIKIEPNERLGASDDLKKEGYISLRKHSFISNETFVIDLQKFEEDTITTDPDLVGVDKIKPGLDEAQLLRLLTIA